MMILYLVMFAAKADPRQIAVVTIDRSFEVEGQRARRPTALEIANSGYFALANHLGVPSETKLSVDWRLLRADRLEIQMDPKKANGGFTTVKPFV
jgi:hypothetical protein